MDQKVHAKSYAKHTVQELDSLDWKLVRKGCLYEFWQVTQTDPSRQLTSRQREATVNKKGLVVHGVETYRTWGFGLMPPSVITQTLWVTTDC